MELRQLKYFLSVADQRSFVGAANKLYISRQAVSKAVSQLEAELGVELFARDSSGAFLTPAGLMFYDRIRGSVKELEQVCREMQQYGARYQQRVRMAFSLGILQMYEKALDQFDREQENLILEYRELPHQMCLDVLREHRADMLISTEKPKDAEFSAHTLTRSPYGVLLQRTEALEEIESLALEDLNWIPLAALEDGGIDQMQEKHGLQLQYRGYDLYRLFCLVKEGRCAMLMPMCMVPEQMEGLIWLPLEGMEPWALYSICLRSLEKNVLYHTMIEELQSRVLRVDRTGMRGKKNV